MLREFKISDLDFDRSIVELLDRKTSIAVDIEQSAKKIVNEVRARGNDAMIEFTRRYDHRDITQWSELELTREQIDGALESLDPEIKKALTLAADRIRDFHQRELLQSWSYTESDGTVLGQRVTPLDRVGVYVPGGKAAYPSSVLMTAIPARVAGVKEIIMTVPTPSGEVNSIVIAAASLAGVDRIFSVGGAQAVAALAYATETIPKVDKIVGPGNAYVAAAKKIVFGDVGIDMIAGPSEVVVICDDGADPDWVAMDLFAQAEHDEMAQSIAITTSQDMADAIQASIAKLLPDMERHNIIQKSLQSQGAIIIVNTLDEAATVSDQIAPEHLELMVEDAESMMQSVNHAGAIFVGKYSAEALGDYCAGPNHVLPTAGTAKFSSPLGAYDFLKRTSVIQASQDGARKMAEVASVLANCEGLTAHQRSAELRLK